MCEGEGVCVRGRGVCEGRHCNPHCIWGEASGNICVDDITSKPFQISLTLDCLRSL